MLGCARLALMRTQKLQVRLRTHTRTHTHASLSRVHGMALRKGQLRGLCLHRSLMQACMSTRPHAHAHAQRHMPAPTPTPAPALPSTLKEASDRVSCPRPTSDALCSASCPGPPPCCCCCCLLCARRRLRSASSPPLSSPQSNAPLDSDTALLPAASASAPCPCCCCACASGDPNALELCLPAVPSSCCCSPSGCPGLPLPLLKPGQLPSRPRVPSAPTGTRPARTPPHPHTHRLTHTHRRMQGAVRVQGLAGHREAVAAEAQPLSSL